MTDTTLVQRLRERARTSNGSLVGASDGNTYALGYYDQFAAADDKKAADEIDRLTAELAEARNILEFYANPFDFVARNNLDEGTPDFYDELDTGWRARSFLASKGE